MPQVWPGCMFSFTAEGFNFMGTIAKHNHRLFFLQLIKTVVRLSKHLSTAGTKKISDEKQKTLWQPCKGRMFRFNNEDLVIPRNGASLTAVKKQFKVAMCVCTIGVSTGVIRVPGYNAFAHSSLTI